MIRIAFVVDEIAAPEGGTETQMLMLLKGLDPDRFKPHLVYLRSSPFLARNSFPYPVTCIPVAKLLSGQFARGLEEFKRMNRKEGFDIVQTTFWDSMLFGTIAARVSGCPTVVYSRRSLGYWKTWEKTALMKVARLGITHYITNSEPVKDEIVKKDGVAPERISVIANGIDLDAFDREPSSSRAETRSGWGFGEDNLVIGGVSTLRPVKQVVTLINAAASLIREFPHLRFVWVGSGAVAEHREMAASLGLGDRFIFPGPSRTVPRVLAGMDIAVQTSATESLSNSLLEYMAAGLPIAASDVGGTKHAIIDGRTGLLFDPDKPGALEDSLRRMIQDPDLRGTMGNSARSAAHSRFSKEVMIRSHEELYSRLQARASEHRRRNGAGK